MPHSQLRNRHDTHVMSVENIPALDIIGAQNWYLRQETDRINILRDTLDEVSRKFQQKLQKIANNLEHHEDKLHSIFGKNDKAFIVSNLANLETTVLAEFLLSINKPEVRMLLHNFTNGLNRQLRAHKTQCSVDEDNVVIYVKNALQAFWRMHVDDIFEDAVKQLSEAIRHVYGVKDKRGLRAYINLDDIKNKLAARILTEFNNMVQQMNKGYFVDMIVNSGVTKNSRTAINHAIEQLSCGNLQFDGFIGVLAEVAQHAESYDEQSTFNNLMLLLDSAAEHMAQNLIKRLEDILSVYEHLRASREELRKQIVKDAISGKKIKAETMRV